MDINFNKQAGQRILEIGCGEKRHPMSDVAVDSRKFPCVDFVVDLNLPFDAEHGQAIGTAEFDAVLSVYSIEHVSWRNFRGLLKEICRVLKPGGKLIAVTANLYEQCKMFVEKCDEGDFDDRWVCQIFGDQNYGPGDDGKAWLGNAHFVGFDPKKLALMLREAGFADVQISPLPEWRGDLVVQATKGTEPQLAWKGEVPMVRETIIMENKPAELVKGMEVDPNNAARWAEFHKAIKADEAKEKEPVRPGPLTDKERAETAMQFGMSGSSEFRAKQFGRRYFDGGPAHPLPLGCHDHPSNHIVARRVLERQPASVLELGCGRGYVLKRLQDAGVYGAWGLDISKHAFMTRVMDGITLWDICQIPWVDNGLYGTQGVDLCFSLNFWEHVQESLIPAVAAEMERTCKRGLHGIGFAANADPTRVTIRDRKWWRERLPKGHEVIDADELRVGPLGDDVLKGDGKTKLNVGSFVTCYHQNWTNIDVHDLASFAQGYGYNYLRHDVRQGLPFGTGSVDLIAMSHFLEHLNYDDGLQFLRECRRVIKPTGAVRIAVPCASQLAAAYCDDVQNDLIRQRQLDEFDEISTGCANRKTAAGKLWETLMAGGHQALYDWDTLHAALADAGFESVCAGFRQPGYPLNDACQQLVRETLDIGVSHSIFAAAIPAIG